MTAFVKVLFAGPLFFVGSWILMIFAGVEYHDLVIRPVEYVTPMVDRSAHDRRDRRYVQARCRLRVIQTMDLLALRQRTGTIACTPMFGPCGVRGLSD